MNPTIKSIMAQIETLPFEDRRMLNKLLVAHLNAEQKVSAAENAMKFRINDMVKFDAGPRKGGIVTIQITGFSRDLSSIKGIQVGGARAGTNWTVFANLCEKA
ncbi:hypothetical protein [Acinetobacter sp.]|uniref:hypothetical protein n=1 Tax=Acinetobacter sp. TaxID=472 RepID=UPI00388F0F73